MGKIERPWQETKEVLGLFGRTVKQAREKYRHFVTEGVADGKRRDLMGGGLVRSAGGWESVAALRRGRESYSSDERILGSSEFVESILKEAAKQDKRRISVKRVNLETLKKRICADFQINLTALEAGSRVPAVSSARAVLCYVWLRHLGRSGRQLAEQLGVSPQAVYFSAAKIEKGNGLNDDDLENWCR